MCVCLYIYIAFFFLVIGMTKPIPDDQTRKDDFTLMTRSSNAHIAKDHKTAIQYLQ